MFDRFKYLFISLIFHSSCTNEFFPEKLYDYQVERLLSGGDNKVWDLVIDSQNCQDSVRLFVELLSSSTDDSVVISEIIRGGLCNPDTSLTGHADASSFEDAIFFTDTLNFDNGEFWIIERITNQTLILSVTSELDVYSSK